MYVIVPYLGAFRIHRATPSGAPSGVHVEQHGSEEAASVRLAQLNHAILPRATPPAPTPAKAAPAKAARVTPPAPDLSVLDQSIANLAAALATGDYDRDLPALIQQEQAGKTRTGALAVLTTRLSETAGA